MKAFPFSFSFFDRKIFKAKNVMFTKRYAFIWGYTHTILGVKSYSYSLQNSCKCSLGCRREIKIFFKPNALHKNEENSTSYSLSKAN